VDYEAGVGVAVTCASCHASLDASGRPSGVRSNRQFDLGRLRLEHGGANEQNAVDATASEDLLALGPGRSDVQNDGVFNPYAFADFGGIADMPYLHHTANWHNRGVATLAIRVETVFMNDGRTRSRPPRVLMWALAEYLRSLPAPPPTHAPSPASARGQAVFEASGCDACHTPPLYSSSERVDLDVIGTDATAGDSPVRGTGYWRVPSLRGVGGNAPYLHHGAFATLEEMFSRRSAAEGFDPERDEPGHPFGLELSADDRADLLAFLRTI
jgi:cytochrome c peroxidase